MKYPGDNWIGVSLRTTLAYLRLYPDLRNVVRHVLVVQDDTSLDEMRRLLTELDKDPGGGGILRLEIYPAQPEMMMLLALLASYPETDFIWIEKDVVSQKHTYHAIQLAASSGTVVEDRVIQYWEGMMSFPSRAERR